MRKTWFYLALTSLVWDVIVTGSVALNLTWVKKIAAGGQYETFPSNVRITYLTTVLFALWAITVIWKLKDKFDQSQNKFVWVIMVLYFLSAIAQLTSKSGAERFNLIPALLIAFGFNALRRD